MITVTALNAVTADTAHATSLPIWFDVTVMGVNALFGAAVARDRNTPVYGTLLAAILVGLGGGMIRDVLLGLEPAAIASWYYLPAALIGGTIGALLFGKVLGNPRVLALAQGITLGFLVTIGAQKALDYQAPILSAVFLGIVTASFGGILADVMTGYRASVAKQAHWLASALAVGSFAFVLTSLWVGFWPAVVVGVVAVTVLRYVSQVRNWPSPRWPGESMSTPDSPPN